MDKPYGTSVFCDSIHQEVNGKFIYVGVYNDAMIFEGEPPATLNQLSVIAELNIPKDFKFSSVEMVICLVGDSSEKQKILFNQNYPAPEDIPVGFIHPDGIVKIRILSHLNNMQIDTNGHLSVRSYLDDTEVKMGALRIEFKRPETRD